MFSIPFSWPATVKGTGLLTTCISVAIIHLIAMHVFMHYMIMLINIAYVYIIEG